MTNETLAHPQRERDPVDKAFEVLRWMLNSEDTSWGVREVARGLERPPSTIHRALASLESQGLVVGDESSGRYEFGLELHRLAAVTMARFPLRVAAQPTLLELQQTCDETAFLGELSIERLEMIFTATVESTRPLRYVVAVNEWAPLFLGSSGIAICSFLDPELQEKVLERVASVKDFPGEAVTVESVRKAMEETRQQGYARTVGQRVPDGVGIAAPVFNAAGVVIGDVGVTLPTSRYDRSMCIEEAVVHSATRLSESLHRGV